MESNWVTNKSKEECDKSGGRYGPLFSWKENVWRESKWEKLQWKRREPKSQYKAAEGFSLLALASDVEEIVNNEYAQQAKTVMKCQFNPIVQAVAQVACDCTNDKTTKCSSPGPLVDVGSGNVCPNATSTIQAPPSTLLFASKTKLSVDRCLSLSILLASAQGFRDKDTSSLGTTLISISSNNNKRGTWTFNNNRDAVVGQLLGSGVSFKITGGSSIGNFILCLDINPNMETKDTYNNFPIVGVAYSERDTKKLIPLPQTGWIQDRKVCSQMEQISNDGRMYFPIAREQDWEDERVFSSSERKFIIFVGVVYAFICLTLVVAVVANIALKTSSFAILQFAAGNLAAFSLLRCIYFFMVVDEKITTQGWSDFILVELATVIFFCAFILIYLTWIVIEKMSNGEMDDKSRDQWVFVRFFGCSFLVVLYFVAFIIAFALIDKGGETQLCGGRITITETSSQPKTLAIVYQAIFAGLCLLLGLSIAYTGGSLYRQIDEAEQVKKSHNSAANWA
eukprot:TRINITY_DN962_c0_g2_i1.p1 TRINITY_DN962_c0_g2~~TRINITY_DN962_c0_g2_i1.p1  ORF type:complete len:518 (-),score=165.54 TRINITY_DN962_c0_g2_i1:347-1873(-)